jgi:hypothetical protein
LGVHDQPEFHESPGETVTEDALGCGCIQALLGLLAGGVTWFLLIGIEPSWVNAFEFQQGVNPADQQAAFERWNNSLCVNLARLVEAWLPIWVSGLCGVFAHWSRPVSLPVALLRMLGLTLMLAVVTWAGMPIAERALGTGGSSDLQGPFAALLLAALCLALAAPLSSAATCRRPPAKETQPADKPRRDA